MTVYKIPLTNVPQKFDIDLAGIALSLENKWNAEHSVWEVTITDATTAMVLVAALPLVTGCNLLEQHAHLGIPGSLICYTEGDQYAPPTLENLGESAGLFYVVDE